MHILEAPISSKMSLPISDVKPLSRALLIRETHFEDQKSLGQSQNDNLRNKLHQVLR